MKEREEVIFSFPWSTARLLTRFFPEAHPLPGLSSAGVCWRGGRPGRDSSSGMLQNREGTEGLKAGHAWLAAPPPLPRTPEDFSFHD